MIEYKSPDIVQAIIAERAAAAAIGDLAVDAVCMLGDAPREEIHDQRVHITLNALSTWVEEPFNDPEVLRHFYELAGNIGPLLLTYDLVVADAISGILPAAVLWRIVNNVRDRNGLSPALIASMNGKHGDTAPDGTFPVAAHQSSRALAVTEAIFTGKTVGNVRSAVAYARNGLPVDVAALRVDWNHSSEWCRTLSPDSSVFGPTNQNIGLVDDKFYMTGVIRATRKLLGLTKRYDDLHASLDPDSETSQERINKAYDDALRVGDTLAALLLNVRINGHSIGRQRRPISFFMNLFRRHILMADTVDIKP